MNLQWFTRVSNLEREKNITVGQILKKMQFREETLFASKDKITSNLFVLSSASCTFLNGNIFDIFTYCEGRRSSTAKGMNKIIHWDFSTGIPLPIGKIFSSGCRIPNHCRHHEMRSHQLIKILTGDTFTGMCVLCVYIWIMYNIYYFWINIPSWDRLLKYYCMMFLVVVRNNKNLQHF